MREDAHNQIRIPGGLPQAGGARPRLGGVCITREQFLLREMRIACELRESGLGDDEIVARIAGENLFQYPTERTVARIARACVKRMNVVDSPQLVRVIASGMAPAPAQANLYVMMCTYPLVRHFMVHEVGCRYAEFNYQLGPSEVGAYLTYLQTQYENIAALSDTTVVKLRQVLRHNLVECGMLQTPRSQTLVPVPLDSEVRAVIEARRDAGALYAFGESGVL